MTRTPVTTGQFRRDVQRVRKQGKDLATLRGVMAQLVAGVKLEPRFRDHKLKGAWGGRRECHIEPDCLLIYVFKATEVIFERLGSHAELFE